MVPAALLALPAAAAHAQDCTAKPDGPVAGCATCPATKRGPRVVYEVQEVPYHVVNCPFPGLFGPLFPGSCPEEGRQRTKRILVKRIITGPCSTVVVPPTPLPQMAPPRQPAFLPDPALRWTATTPP
jgi:hypothetical protein